ncbi:hypothetical protein Ccrd_005118 [Cynara cardunculus var. scolymus]|uniref:Uncharacterized protein n=1 Tax=Cynara cardunculus var. scolymus TaxID=59895 RepID=A0A103XLC1_CYNCS|nr:hypothetical protein Ccrd_005118 [Cynara cardunculus var. scolymus]
MKMIGLHIKESYGKLTDGWKNLAYGIDSFGYEASCRNLEINTVGRIWPNACSSNPRWSKSQQKVSFCEPNTIGCIFR